MTEVSVPILLVQLPVAAVSIDEAKFPDRDESHFLEHLVRYCEKFEPLPAITVAVEGNKVKVIRGHKYLVAARMLGRPTIRAVIASPSASDEVKTFLARGDVTTLDWEAIKAKEDQEPNPRGWHVFFFARSLSSEEKLDFNQRVWTLFSDRTISVVHDDVGPVAEFEAYTPVTDAAFAARHLETFKLFSNERVAIVSYQGRRFGAPQASGPS